MFLVESSNEVSFTVKQTSDLSKIGRYEVGYKVWYTNEPATVAYSSSPFTVEIYEESNEMENTKCKYGREVRAFFTLRI